MRRSCSSCLDRAMGNEMLIVHVCSTGAVLIMAIVHVQINSTGAVGQAAMVGVIGICLASKFSPVKLGSSSGLELAEYIGSTYFSLCVKVAQVPWIPVHTNQQPFHAYSHLILFKPIPCQALPLQRRLGLFTA